MSQAVVKQWSVSFFIPFCILPEKHLLNTYCMSDLGSRGPGLGVGQSCHCTGQTWVTATPTCTRLRGVDGCSQEEEETPVSNQLAVAVALPRSHGTLTWNCSGLMPSSTDRYLRVDQAVFLGRVDRADQNSRSCDQVMCTVWAPRICGAEALRWSDELSEAQVRMQLSPADSRGPRPGRA